MNIEKQINQLISQLTLEEKIGMIHGNGLFETKGVPRLGIPPFKFSDGPMGVRQTFLNDTWQTLNQSDDFATYLPSGSAIAASWNLKLAKTYGKVLGNESRARQKDMILGPSINIVRSPLCGRNFEYLSEDTFLTKSFVKPMITGIQSADVAACAKHFAANNQETNRLSVDVIIDKKALHEVYLPAFKEAVDAGTLGMMGAYNKINGEFCSHSEFLLNEVLRKKWGYEHILVSDWGAVNDTIAAAQTGIDVEMSVTKNFDEYFMAEPLKKLILDKEIDETLIDKKISNILRVMFKTKMLESKDRNPGSYNTVKHQKLSYDVSKESIILLKNDNILPLNKKVNKILVIGDNAIKRHSNEGGSAEIKALFEMTPLMALKMKLGGNCEVHYVSGYDSETKKEQEINWQATSLTEDKQNISEISNLKSLLNEAVDMASKYEHVIYCGGLNHSFDLEGQDRSDYKLPYEQDELINKLLDANPNMIIYMNAGASFDMSTWIGKAKAVLYSSYIGMHGGTVLADTLFGDVNPSGKLTYTIARKLTDYSSHSIGEFPGDKEVKYSEGVYVGYKHFISNNIKPIYPFGFGMSYTSFDYKNVSFIKNKQYIIINALMKNTGKYEGSDILQAYVTYMDETKPYPSLKGFVKTNIKPNQEKEVTIKISIDDFKTYDEKTDAFKLLTGTYRIEVGTSALDIIASKDFII